MKNQKKTFFADEDIRSLLKSQHKKVYSICRLFANNYKEHQALFSNILAAASQMIRTGESNNEKKTLFLRACINMAALHSLSRDLNGPRDGGAIFESPDYQKSMVGFRAAIEGTTDYEKILLFLNFEKVATEDIPGLTGLAPSPSKDPKQTVGQRLIPHIKEKILWS
jgi:hypothetical protein